MILSLPANTDRDAKKKTKKKQRKKTKTKKKNEKKRESQRSIKPNPIPWKGDGTFAHSLYCRNSVCNFSAFLTSTLRLKLDLGVSLLWQEFYRPTVIRTFKYVTGPCKGASLFGNVAFGQVSKRGRLWRLQ